MTCEADVAHSPCCASTTITRLNASGQRAEPHRLEAVVARIASTRAISIQGMTVTVLVGLVQQGNGDAATDGSRAVVRILLRQRIRH